MGEPIVYVNNIFVPESEARISVMDHAFLYGDGVFDTAVAWNKRVFELDAHVDRFFRSMAAIAMGVARHSRAVEGSGSRVASA